MLELAPTNFSEFSGNLGPGIYAFFDPSFFGDDGKSLFILFRCEPLHMRHDPKFLVQPVFTWPCLGAYTSSMRILLLRWSHQIRPGQWVVLTRSGGLDHAISFFCRFTDCFVKPVIISISCLLPKTSSAVIVNNSLSWFIANPLFQTRLTHVQAIYFTTGIPVYDSSF